MGTLRHTVIIASCLAAAGTPAAMSAQADAAARLRDAQAAIRASDRALRETLKEQPKRYTPEFEREQTDALKDALGRYVTAFLTTRPAASAADIASTLRTAYNPWDEPHRLNTPHVIKTNAGDRRYVIVSWLLFRGGAGLPRTKGFIQAFADGDGPPVLVATAGDEFDGHGLIVREVKSPRPGEIWMLAYGQRFGDTGARNNIVMYAFDGKTFTVKWSRTELSALRVEVNEPFLRLRYSRSGGAAPPGARADAEEVVEDYRIVDDGLERVRSGK